MHDLQSIWDGTLGSEAEELRKGARPYLDVLKELHAALKPRRYLEIGVRFGHSLALATCDAIGVDPAPEVRLPLSPRAKVIEMPSDEFFASASKKGPFDLIFIDGMHLFENALRDFINAERVCAPGAVVVFDDVFPNHPRQAERVRQIQTWTGDVWKISPALKKWRPDLRLLELDTYPTGLLCVTNLDSKNDALSTQFEAIVEQMATATPDKDILDRSQATDPQSSAIMDFVSQIPQEGLLSRIMRLEFSKRK